MNLTLSDYKTVLDYFRDAELIDVKIFKEDSEK